MLTHRFIRQYPQLLLIYTDNQYIAFKQIRMSQNWFKKPCFDLLLYLKLTKSLLIPLLVTNHQCFLHRNADT